jgi:integrase
VHKERERRKRGGLRKRGPLAPATLNRELAFLRRIFNVAIEDKKLETPNPVSAKLFAKENNARVRFLTDDEESKLREAIGADEWPKVAVAIHTGLRRGEQFNLRWEYVDFTTGLITVPRSKHGKLRRVPMNDTVREILRAFPSRLKSPYVFSSETGETPIDATELSESYVRPGGEAGRHRGLPLARSPAHIREPPRHGRGRSSDGTGAHGPQYTSYDASLFASIARASTRSGTTFEPTTK